MNIAIVIFGELLLDGFQYDIFGAVTSNKIGDRHRCCLTSFLVVLDIPGMECLSTIARFFVLTRKPPSASTEQSFPRFADDDRHLLTYCKLVVQSLTTETKQR